MLCSFITRFRSIIWFLFLIFTLYSISHLEYLLPYKLRFSLPDAQAGETQIPEAQIEGSQEGISAEAPVNEEPSSNEPSSKEPSAAPMTTMTSGMAEPSELGISSLSLLVDDFTGAAHLNHPISVPPGRKGIAPNLSLIYNSHRSNGWVGVGWNLDMGAIQRSIKRGVNYSAIDYVLVRTGSNSELLSRSDWGSNYYGNRIEGEFSKYYLNTSTGGWEVTTRDGTKHYYGTTSDSRQDNTYGVFDPHNVSVQPNWEYDLEFSGGDVLIPYRLSESSSSRCHAGRVKQLHVRQQREYDNRCRKDHSL